MDLDGSRSTGRGSTRTMPTARRIAGSGPQALAARARTYSRGLVGVHTSHVRHACRMCPYPRPCLWTGTEKVAICLCLAPHLRAPAPEIKQSLHSLEIPTPLSSYTPHWLTPPSRRSSLPLLASEHIHGFACALLSPTPREK